MFSTGVFLSHEFDAFPGLCGRFIFQLQQTCAIVGRFVLYPTSRAIVNCNIVFHGKSELSNVKGNFDTTAQFANANVIHTGKSTIQKTVGQFNVIDHADQSGNANQRVDLLSLKHFRHLDFVIVVDFAGRVL